MIEKMSIFFFVTVTCIIIRFAKHFHHCLESNRYKFSSPEIFSFIVIIN